MAEFYTKPHRHVSPAAPTGSQGSWRSPAHLSPTFPSCLSFHTSEQMPVWSYSPSSLCTEVLSCTLLSRLTHRGTTVSFHRTFPYFCSCPGMPRVARSVWTVFTSRRWESLNTHCLWFWRQTLTMKCSGFLLGSYPEFLTLYSDPSHSYLFLLNMQPNWAADVSK